MPDIYEQYDKDTIRRGNSRSNLAVYDTRTENGRSSQHQLSVSVYIAVHMVSKKGKGSFMKSKEFVKNYKQPFSEYCPCVIDWNGEIYLCSKWKLVEIKIF